MDPQKILKRTLSGSALAGSLAVVLVGNSRSAHGLVLLVALALVIAASAFELARMGSLRGRSLLPALLLAAAGSAGLAWAARARWIASGELGARGWGLHEALSG